MSKINEVSNNFLNVAKRLVGKVPFMRDAVALYWCMRDDDTPWQTKTMIASALTYLVLPVDLIPDPILGIGFTDDFGGIMAALKNASGYMWPEHYMLADQTFGYNLTTNDYNVEYEVTEQ